MASGVSRISIKFLFVGLVLFMTSVAVIVSVSVRLNTEKQHHALEQRNNITNTARMIAHQVVLIEQIYRDEIRGWPDDVLDFLEQIPSVLTVHIYLNSTSLGESALSNQNIQTAYDKVGQPQIPKRTSNDLARLIEPRQSDNGYEFMYPIVGNTGEIGLLYIRLSDDQYEDFLSSSLLRSSIMILFILLASGLLAWRFQRIITEPIETLTQFMRRVARTGEYSATIDTANTSDVEELSSALNTLLKRMQGYVEKNHKMEQEYQSLNAGLEEMVSQRTTALKEANQELIQTLEKLHQFQRQIVQNEKMASLGDMVAGVAHEVNTPIGLGVTASTMMLDRLKTLKDDFESKNLKASSMQKFVTEGEENLNIIYRNLNRAAELISSFKQVAVDQSSENSRVFILSQLIDEILLSMRPRLKKVKHQISVECDKELCIESKAGPINQILINLIMNSIIHGFDGVDSGEIVIKATMLGKHNLKIMYSDNGKGIPEAIRKKIFDPFVTTKRGQGGSGLGMHLVYNLITQALNGSITLESQSNQGVKFDIVFPVRQMQIDKVLSGRYE